jgi:tetrahydromethanopterin S-methyltransferase subunit F
LFSEKQLYAYSNTFDLTSYETSEITQEFFYEDISSIDVTINEVEYLKPRSMGFLIGCWIAIILGFILGFIPTIIGILLLIFAGHTRGIVKNLVLKITVPNDEFVCVMKPDNLKAIQGMKAKIREKKM